MTIIITGANRGIGKALASQYKNAGSSIIGTSRNATYSSDCIQLDVSDPHSVSGMVATLDNQPISTLICNAGVFLDKGQQLDDGYPADQWADSFSANVFGVFACIQAFLPNLRQADNPKIAIIASRMATSSKAPGGSYIYRASKAAALNLGRNLAVDLKDDGVALGIYHPGWVRTDMGSQSADISVEESASGLIERIEHLSLGTTGCFEGYNGEPMDF